MARSRSRDRSPRRRERSRSRSRGKDRGSDRRDRDRKDRSRKDRKDRDRRSRPQPLSARAVQHVVCSALLGASGAVAEPAIDGSKPLVVLVVEGPQAAKATLALPDAQWTREADVRLVDHDGGRQSAAAVPGWEELLLKLSRPLDPVADAVPGTSLSALLSRPATSFVYEIVGAQWGGWMCLHPDGRLSKSGACSGEWRLEGEEDLHLLWSGQEAQVVRSSDGGATLNAADGQHFKLKGSRPSAIGEDAQPGLEPPPIDASSPELDQFVVTPEEMALHNYPGPEDLVVTPSVVATLPVEEGEEEEEEGEEEEAQQRSEYRQTQPRPEGDATPAVLALDCEMIETTKGYELARATLVDQDGATVLDVLVKPAHPVVNYHTEFSGITEKLLQGVRTTLAEAQEALLTKVWDDTVLVGHALDNDLRSMRLVHRRLLDTAIIFPHPRGPPFRPGLKSLAASWLRLRVQEGTEGHDSAEDALTSLRLAQHKVARGAAFGERETVDTASESLLDAVSRAKGGVPCVAVVPQWMRRRYRPLVEPSSATVTTANDVAAVVAAAAAAPPAPLTLVYAHVQDAGEQLAQLVEALRTPETSLVVLAQGDLSLARQLGSWRVRSNWRNGRPWAQESEWRLLLVQARRGAVALL